MAGHTSGPWNVREFEDYEGGNPWYRIDAETTLFLDVVECADGYVPGQNKANAHLIAAAPELIEACQAALDAFGDTKITPGEMTPKQSARFNAVLMLVHAIDKATGGHDGASDHET